MTEEQTLIWERLEDFVEGQIEEYGIPGIAVGVLHAGETFSAGFGVTNIDHPLPVTAETLFQIGSITKTFTGTLMMRLVEMGKLDLDVPVRTYLPEFKLGDETAASAVTARHLLTHVGGFTGDVFDDTGSGLDALDIYVERLAEIEQLAPVGSHFSYNNAGFIIAGLIIERVMGLPYETVLSDLLLEPLGLERTFLNPGDVMTYRFAAGHIDWSGKTEVARPWYLSRSVYPVGGIICDVKDLLGYAAFHLADGQIGSGERILAADSMAAMQTPQITVIDNTYRGLSWAVDDVQGMRMIAHGGGTLGQVSMLILVPEHELALAIFTNDDRGGLATRDISRWLIKEIVGVEISDPTPIDSTKEELAALVGLYSRPYADLELGLLGGRLIGQLVNKEGFPTKDSPPDPPPPPVTLQFCGEDRLIAVDGLMKGLVVDVLRDENGRIGWLRVFGRLHTRQE